MCLQYRKTVPHCSGGTDSDHIMLNFAAPLLVWETSVFFTVNMQNITSKLKLHLKLQSTRKIGCKSHIEEEFYVCCIDSELTSEAFEKTKIKEEPL